ncbi:MAG: IS3 family transposase, partial [Candidatus Cryptobacteroides sp.]
HLKSPRDWLRTHSMKHYHQWSSVEEFEKELRSYIHYYNHDRIKLRLKGKSPVQYRTLYQ